MADPRRYFVEGDAVSANPCGDWIKWHDFLDYKAAQRRNASADTNARLGVEIAELASEVERLRSASFVTAVPSEEYEKLKEENERLRKAGDAMARQLVHEGYSNDREPCKAWNAAKEGRDAK